MSAAENRKPCRGNVFVGCSRAKLGIQFGTYKFELLEIQMEILKRLSYICLEFSREV